MTKYLIKEDVVEEQEEVVEDEEEQERIKYFTWTFSIINF